MANKIDELQAELAALEGHETPAAAMASRYEHLSDERVADMRKRGWTEQQITAFNTMQGHLDELSREGELAAQNAAALKAQEEASALKQEDAEPLREPLLGKDDYWDFKLWQVGREASGLPSAVSDWIEETGVKATPSPARCT